MKEQKREERKKCRRNLKPVRGTAWTETLTGLGVDLAEAVVAHLVHQAVEQNRRTFPVHAELASGGVVVVLPDVPPRVCAASDTHHPQELIYVYGTRSKN